MGILKRWLRTRTIVAVDFDGTVVSHAYPLIGDPVPGAIEWMKRFQERGALLILWTVRNDGSRHGDILKEAVEYCRSNGVEFWQVNENKFQDHLSRKVHAQVYIDDRAAGVPLVNGSIDWESIGPQVLKVIENRNRARQTP